MIELASIILLAAAASVVILVAAPRLIVYVLAFLTLTPIFSIAIWLAVGSSVMRCVAYAAHAPSAPVRSEFGSSRPDSHLGVFKTFVACGYASAEWQNSRPRPSRDSFKSQRVFLDGSPGEGPGAN